MPDLRDHILSLNGLPIRALSGGSGPLVLCLHGISITADVWRPNLPTLIETGYSVLAIDLPGHGRSFRPARPYDICDLACVVNDLLTALGIERVALIGSSLGGAVASEFARLHPKKAERLVLVDALGLDPVIPVFRRRYWTDLILPVVSTLIVGRRHWSHERVMRLVFHDPSRVPDGVLVLAQPGDWVQNYWGRILVGWGVYLQLAAPARHRAFVRRRAEITVPTLIAWGQDDQLLPVSHAHSGHALIPGSRLHVFPRCGHAPNVECPAAFNRVVVEFLAG